MAITRKKIARMLPEGIKRPIRPVYRYLFAHSSLQRTSTLEIGQFGGFAVAYRDGTADELVLQDSFENDIFFPGVPEYRPREDDTIIDVGAHIGTFALLASTKAPRGRIYAIEASRESSNLCRINAALNGISNLEVSHLALSDHRGSCVLYHSNGNWGHSIVSAQSGAGETVPCDTLANFMEARQIRRCDFMKLNCEGAEFPILLAAPPEVLRRIRVMLVLYHSDLYPGGNEDALISHLQSSGFTTTIREREQEAQRGWIVATRQGRE